MANFVIFAGVNGVGKTTLYNTIIPILDLGIRINTDEIVKEIGDWRNNEDQIKAGRIALKLRKECVEKNIDFNQETTLTGKNILKAIKDIKEKGYTLHLYYVGIESPEISKERIKNRVVKGGHDIPADVVEKRYIETLENLKEILLFTDKSDISEEISRLDSHMEQLKKELSLKGAAVGKKIDFILQEIYRELNTTGVKSNLYEISKLIVECKNELEKIREQSMNIE